MAIEDQLSTGSPLALGCLAGLDDRLLQFVGGGCGNYAIMGDPRVFNISRGPVNLVEFLRSSAIGNISRLALGCLFSDGLATKRSWNSDHERLRNC